MYNKIPFIKTKVKNYLKKKYEVFPELLSIEITSACNAVCIMCPHDTMTRKVEHMSLDVFNKIILDCKDKPLKKINLFWFGDPICNPNIITYLEKVKEVLPGVKVYISTNAELLSEKFSDEMLEKKLIHVMNFDIDGITKETYESIRVGVDFDKVMKNVHYFIRKKKELGDRRPEVRVTIIKMDKTENEVDDFKKYWKKYADKVGINDYNTWLGEKEDRNVGTVLDKSQQGYFRYPCIHPWSEMVIAANGMAGLCCLDYDLTAELGDVMEESINEIWHGKKINSYREKMINLKYEDIDCCKKCNAYIYQDDQLWAKSWMSE